MMKLRISLALLIVVLAISCQKTESPKENMTFEEKNPISGNAMMVKMPSPVDYYLLIKQEGAAFKPDLLPGLSYAEHSLEHNAKYFALGVLSSSILYLTVFEQNYLVTDYFKQALVLSQELGLNRSFNSQSVLRIQKNIHSVDSLRNISEQIFQNTISQLDTPEDSLSYALLLAGGWFQSMVIGINSENQTLNEEKLAFIVSEQSLVLENLLSLMNTDMAIQTIYYQNFNKMYEILLQASLNENALPNKQQISEIKTLTNKWKSEWIN